MDEIKVEHDYDLGPDFEPIVVATVLQNPSFFDRFHPVLVPDAFLDRRWREIITEIREFHAKYKEVPDTVVLANVIRRSTRRDPGTLTKALEDLPHVNGSAGYVKDRLLQWVKWQAVEQALSDNDLREDPREFAREIERASRVGDDLQMEYTRLDVDKDDEYIRNEVIPTPWTWLNARMLGGPERRDLVVVMTIINGGKTTILTNIARECAGLGKNVVFFTFEDGETKIKRRLLQSIAGMTTEEVIENLALARSRRDRFLQATGGMVHVKQMRSRRSSVDDAISFVKSIEDASGRAVDVVVTDYADRFRPQGRYTEPRHGLREVYEDCKFLATDTNTLHYTASQINTKQQMGKEVVGIEHGSESTGKFESCDMAIGFGQSLEDQRLGRMTLFTSKMRDAKKCEMTSLIADFSRQRIYEPGDERFTRRN